MVSKALNLRLRTSGEEAASWEEDPAYLGSSLEVLLDTLELKGQSTVFSTTAKPYQVHRLAAGAWEPAFEMREGFAGGEGGWSGEVVL